MKKIVSIIALCLIVATLSVSIIGCSGVTLDAYKDIIKGEDASEEDTFVNNAITDDDLSMKDVYLPDKLDREEIGLFWFSPETGWVSATADPDTIPFDDSKPISIGTHGMGSGSISYEEVVYEAGYNVGEFRWEQLGDGDPGQIPKLQSRIWSVTEGMMGYVYENEKGRDVIEYNDVPNHSVAWIYASYYNDFMKTRPNYHGSSIQIYGHSFGGQLTLAVTSCLIWGVKTGRVAKEYLPEKITMLDPYLSICNDGISVCEWLGKKLPDGVITDGIEELKKIREMGIAVSLLRTSPYIFALCKFVGSIVPKEEATARFEELYPDLQKLTMHVEIDTSFLEEQMSNPADAINERHVVAEKWYPISAAFDYLKDDSDSTGNSYGFNLNMPASYNYGRVGTFYTLDLHDTELDESDDTIVSTSITNAKITGFAFEDKNDNGILDDRMGARVKGVKVSLYKEGQASPVQTVTTNEGGAYEFIIDDLSASYYVKVEGAKGYNVSTKTASEKDYPMCVNNVSNNGQTEVFKLTNVYALKVVNIGLTK